MAKGHPMKNQFMLQVLLLAIIIAVVSERLVMAETTITHLKQWSIWSHSDKGAGYALNMVQPGDAQGHKGAKFQSNLPDQKNCFVAIFEDFSPDQFKGQDFKYTAWIKTDKVKGKATLWATAEDNNNVLSFDDMDNRAVTGTSGWQKYSIVLNVPPQSKRLHVGFMLKGGGTAWYGDPSVVLAPRSAKLTVRSFDPNKFKLNVLESAPKNLSFDGLGIKSTDSDNVVFQWSASGEKGSTIHLDKITTLNGKPSVRADCDKDNRDGFASIYQLFSPKDYIGKRIRFSGYIKADNVKDWSSLFMQVDSPERVLAFDAMEERPIKGTRDWTKCEVVLDVPAQATKIKIGTLQAGGGISWVSNCSLDVVDKTVPTTGKGVVDDKLPQPNLPAKPDFDFE